MTVIQVSLSDAAWQGIRRELRESAAALAQHHETGGWCWSQAGYGWWRTQGLEIVFASGPGDRPKRDVAAIDYDVASLESVDEAMRRQGNERAGMWHTHPGGDDQPSEPDEKRIDGLLARREEWRSRTQRALELILTPAPGDDWTIHPWVYHRTKERGIALPAGIPGLAEAAVMKGR